MQFGPVTTTGYLNSVHVHMKIHIETHKLPPHPPTNWQCCFSTMLKKIVKIVKNKNMQKLLFGPVTNIRDLNYIHVHMIMYSEIWAMGLKVEIGNVLEVPPPTEDFCFSHFFFLNEHLHFLKLFKTHFVTYNQHHN